ncbi:MAG: translation initiation factor IF-2 N-terminal domain-containing protein, partial [Planctomycetota bacterium]|nr:translation initiation factor IF-2 N-terminal domain-containing protein [Planctomycetota bacterium]
MAKKTSVKRVHQLAKELGVSSKDIVSKCQAEGIPDITNHMSAISVGLSVTVREWFGGGVGESTAVETAAPVDGAAARKKAPKRAKAKTKAKPKAAAGDAGATVTDVAPVATTDEPAAESTTATAPTSSSTGDATAIPVDSDPPPGTDASEGSTEGPGDDGPRESTESPVMNVPKRPEVVSPAGTKLTEKKKVKLSGPVVVRVEQPDPVAPPRAPRPPRGQDGMDPRGYQTGGPRTGGGVRD